MMSANQPLIDRRTFLPNWLWAMLSVGAFMLSCMEAGPWTIDAEFSRKLFAERRWYPVGEDPIANIDEIEVYCSHEKESPALSIGKMRQLPLIYKTVDEKVIREIVLSARTAQGNPGSYRGTPESIYFVLALDRKAMRVGRFDYYEYEGQAIGNLHPYPQSYVSPAPGVADFLNSKGIKCNRVS